MRSKKILISLFTFAIAGFLLLGCSKDVINTLTQKESNADKNSVFAEQTFDQEQIIVDGVMMSYGGSKSPKAGLTTSSPCQIITFDLLSSPMKATIDFGTVNCPCADGKNRRGKIIVTFNGRLSDSLTFVTSTFDNYFVDDDQVTGTRTVTNKGHNTAGHINFQIITDGSIILANNGGTITYKTNHNREWTEGGSTPLDISDDVYTLSGSSSGTTTTNQAFTIVISSPLVWTISCNHFVKGVFDLTPADEVTRTVDFGNGECDAIATVTVLGFTFQITLP
jgi:hypothetical protein